MPKFIHALEPRRLFAVNPLVGLDLSNLVSDGQAILGDLADQRSSIIVDGKVTNHSLLRLPRSAQNQILVANFRRAQQQWANTLFVRDWHALLRAGLALGKRAGKDGTILDNSGDTDPVAAANLLNDLQTLQTRATPPLNQFLADLPSVTASLTSTLSALASANPSVPLLQSSISTELSDLTSAQTVLQNDASTATMDVTTVINDLSS